MSKEWAAKKRKQIDVVKVLEPDDRLDMVKAVALMNQCILDSCEGWASWIYNPMIISKFSKEELKSFYNSFRRITIDFLEFDVEATEKIKLPPTEKKKENNSRYA